MPGCERAAYLQAGHAIGAFLYGIPVLAVSIIPTAHGESWIDLEELILPATGPVRRRG